MVSVKVKILIPFNKGQEVGDLGNMEKKNALKYEKEGVVEIIKSRKKNLVEKQTKNIKMKKSNKNAYELMYERFKGLNKEVYSQIFAADDRKKEKKIYSNFFDIKKTDDLKIRQEAEHYNIATYGVFTNINPLNSQKRIKDNIIQIQNVFIDLDHANEGDNELIKSFLNKNNIFYWYNAKSGNGYHILIPVDMKTEQEDKVKGFLTYLHNNICNKVDIATYTNERLMRFPNSIHNKNEDSFELQTLEIFETTKEVLENNNSKILEYQLEQKKGIKDKYYVESIKKKDIFFSEILNNVSKWKNYKEYLDNAENRNNNFVKNLAIFVRQNNDYSEKAISFLSNWEPSRIQHVEGWMKKAKDLNMNINYAELYKWCKENNITEWLDLLKNQMEDSFFDDFEVYYLEDEKTESKFLLYYPEKNYYIQTSEFELLNTLYFEAEEKGIDLEDYFNMKELYEDYENKSFKFKLKEQKNQVWRVLHQEKRIKKVFNINYRPEELKFIILNGKRYFNIYNRNSLFEYFHKSKKYHFPHIQELIENLTGEDKEGIDYLYKWLGWIIQNPTEKLPTAIILQGKQGSGKGTFKNLILDTIFGHDNVQEINQTHLESSFNEYLMGKQIIVANEVMHNDNRQTLPNVLKNLVTDPQITISRKFKKEIVGNNYTHWIFCTNSDNPIKIEEDDRRYTVFYSQKLKKGGTKAAKFIKELRENLEFEIKEFVSYLRSLDINFEDVHEPYMTKAKEDIIELNKDSVSRFVEYLKQFDNLVEAHLKIVGNHKINYKTQTNSEDKFLLVEDFYKLYHVWCKETNEYGAYNKQNFGRKIINFGIKNNVKKINDKTLRVYDAHLIENVLLS